MPLYRRCEFSAASFRRGSRQITAACRLWWYAYLTHDTKRNEPYELTRVLLSALDIAQQLLEKNLGRAAHVRTGFLEHIRDHDDQLGTGGVRRERIRALSERRNLTGGVTLLDALGVDEVRAVLDG